MQGENGSSTFIPDAFSNTNVEASSLVSDALHLHLSSFKGESLKDDEPLYTKYAFCIFANYSNSYGTNYTNLGSLINGLTVRTAVSFSPKLEVVFLFRVLLFLRNRS
jgi:hypothetical protein